MVLWAAGPTNGTATQCRTCHRERGRRRRALERANRQSSILARILRSRMAGERLFSELQLLVKLSGGWETFHEHLTPKDRTRLALVLLETAQAEQAKADALERRHQDAQMALDDPALQQELKQLALQQIGRYPTPVIMALAENAPDALAGTLQELGWQVTRPGE
jgi:hypothetical protein